MQQEKAERITITLPPDMLATIKGKVASGAYGSTSEVIREAMRLWEKQEEEHQMRLEAIRQRLEDSLNGGPYLTLEESFKKFEKRHHGKMKREASDEDIYSSHLKSWRMSLKTGVIPAKAGIQRPASAGHKSQEKAAI